MVIINKQGRVLYACGHKSPVHWKYSNSLEMEGASKKLCIKCLKAKKAEDDQIKEVIDFINEVNDYADSLNG